MKTLASDQGDAAKAATKVAIANLEAAGKLIENKAVATREDVKHANSAMLDSVHKAAQSLSAAVALDLTAAPMLLTVLDWTLIAPAATQVWPAALHAGAPPPGSPPIYIALQVLRN